MHRHVCTVRVRPISASRWARLAGVAGRGAPAFAFSERGHAFGSSFGSAGGGSGQFSRPAGAAVNEATGDVYVVDRGNARVERFDSAGKFISAFGYDVGQATKEKKGAGFEVCTGTCYPGLAGKASNKGQLNFPEAIAVDNSNSPSAGDVYVVASVEYEGSFVDKFAPDGTFLRRVTKGEETTFFPGGRIDGVSVDTKGMVWVAFNEEAPSSSPPTNRTSASAKKKSKLHESELNNLQPGLRRRLARQPLRELRTERRIRRSRRRRRR